MTDQQPVRPRLLTRLQVICALREERGMRGLAATAERYGLSPQQVADVLSYPPRTKLSRRMWTALGYKLHEFFEKVKED